MGEEGENDRYAETMRYTKPKAVGKQRREGWAISGNTVTGGMDKPWHHGGMELDEKSVPRGCIQGWAYTCITRVVFFSACFVDSFNKTGHLLKKDGGAAL